MQPNRHNKSCRVLRAKRPRYRERFTLRLRTSQQKRIGALTKLEQRRLSDVFRDSLDDALDQVEAMRKPATP